MRSPSALSAPATIRQTLASSELTFELELLPLQLADVWTDNIDVDEYANLLEDLFDRLTFRDDSGQIVFRDDKDIHFLLDDEALGERHPIVLALFSRLHVRKRWEISHVQDLLRVGEISTALNIRFPKHMSEEDATILVLLYLQMQVCTHWCELLSLQPSHNIHPDPFT